MVDAVQRRRIALALFATAFLVLLLVLEDSVSNQQEEVHKSSSSQFGRLLTASEKRKGEKLGRNSELLFRKSPLVDEERKVQEGVLDKNMIEDLKRDLLNEVMVEKIQELQRQISTCIPRFVCEVHSLGEEKLESLLEKQWFNLHKSNMLKPGRVYQMAAHMGQMFRDVEPNPCQHIYTECPLNRAEL